MICCAAFAFANEKPKFEENEETESSRYFKLSNEESEEQKPGFEEGDETELSFKGLCYDDECDDGRCDEVTGSFGSWDKYKSNFGLEKVFLRFPQDPTITQTSTLLNAYAYDRGVLYSFTGYFPPIGNIMPSVWFDEIIMNLSVYPFSILGSSVSQDADGYWYMDYAFFDNSQNLVTKARAVATPFNGYTLQCVKKSGAKDFFDYFVDHFRIKCECDH